ncbi:MAG: trypsin-like peptidase domain-containing protein [Solirubrobacteraceae bacterium]
MATDSRRSNFLAALLGALVVALPMVGLAIGGAFSFGSDPTPLATPTSDPQSAPAGSSSKVAAPARSATDVSALYERVGPGVVSIEVRGPRGAGSGSGFVIDREGYILTNDHVVENARAVRVRFGEGGPVTARVTGTDPSTDLALLKIDAGERKLTPLPLGSSADLKVGQPAIAIGNPFGQEGSLTTGVISALGRSIPTPNGFSIDNVLQTDAAINPGNSGGPLFDASGRVVGINAQIATTTRSNSGVGFAIPIDAAKEILEQLKSGEQIERPYLGVKTSNAETGTGAVVRDVVRGAPAAEAGLRVGDRVVSVSGSPVQESADISATIAKAEPGDEVKIGVRRGEDERALTVKLGTRPAQVAGG